MARWLAALLLALGATVAQAQTAEDVHRAERERFGFAELRPGASANPDDPNAANSDEAKAGEYSLPGLYTARPAPTALTWTRRRADVVRLVEANWVGRIPEAVSSFTVTWHKSEVSSDARATVEEWIGEVVTPDGRKGPTIDATVTIPRRPAGVAALIAYTYMWPGGQVPAFAAPPLDPVEQALTHGWAYVEYRPQLLQPDTAATMAQGVIGLARWPRERYDWGALRAWGWGASRLREELARDPRIDGERIALTGHSRFGKGVLVAAAFDLAFADAHVSSSGAGGAKLMRRDFGERWENMASPGAFHWYTPNVMFYAQQGHSVDELPVDAHMLIALRAPRPLFVTSGLADKGDAWVDPKGMWLATIAAGRAWGYFGGPRPEGDMPAPLDLSQAGTPLGWYQHDQGHVPWPAYEAFYAHAERFAPPR